MGINDMKFISFDFVVTIILHLYIDQLLASVDVEQGIQQQTQQCSLKSEIFIQFRSFTKIISSWSDRTPYVGCP